MKKETNLRKLVVDYLEEVRLMSLATCNENKPWVCSVWFVFDDKLNLYFISKNFRRHIREIGKNPNIAGAIVKPHKTLGVKVRGIQFEGKASEVSVLELPKAFSLFIKRFPKAKAHIKSIKDIIGNITKVRFYKVRPSKIVLFDEVNFSDNPQQELKLN